MGFEPTVGFPLHTLSKRAQSTTLTSLRLESITYGLRIEPKVICAPDCALTLSAAPHILTGYERSPSCSPQEQKPYSRPQPQPGGARLLRGSSRAHRPIRRGAVGDRKGPPRRRAAVDHHARDYRRLPGHGELDGVSNRTVNMDVGTLRQVLKRYGHWRRLQDHVTMLSEADGAPSAGRSRTRSRSGCSRPPPAILSGSTSQRLKAKGQMLARLEVRRKGTA